MKGLSLPVLFQKNLVEMSSSKTSESLGVLEDKVLANLLNRGKITKDSIRKFKDQITFVKDIYHVPLRREQILEKAVYTISKIDKKISRIEGKSENSTISTDQRELIAEIDKNLKRLNDQKRFLQMAKDCRPDRTWGECLSANKSLRKSNRSRSASEKTPRRCELDKHHVCEVLQKLFEQNCIKIADSGTQVGTSIGRRRARDECLQDQRAKSRSKSARNKRNFAQNVCLWNEFAEKRNCQERERNSPRTVPIRMVSSGTQVGMCARSSKRYSNKKRYGRRTSSESNISRGKFDITTCEASECASGTSLECRSRFHKKGELGSDECFDKFKTTYISTYKPRKGEGCAPEKGDRQKEQSRIEKEVKTRVIYTRSPGKVPIFTSDEQSSIREPKPKKRDKKASSSYDPHYIDSIEKDLNRMPFKPIRLCDELKDYTHQKVVHCDTKNYNKSSLQSPRRHNRPDGHVSFRSRTKTVRSRQVRVSPTNDDGDASQRPLYRISEHRIKIKESRERVGRSPGGAGKLQTDRDKARCQTNNLSAASSSTRLRNLCSVKPNVIEDYTCICPESEENKNYLILPYDPNCTKVAQPTCSHVKCTHCLQDFFSVEDHEKCARIREKSAVILEDISSRESRVYTDSYHLQDSSLITALPSSQYEPRRNTPIPVPYLLQSIDEFQQVPQVRSASDIDTIYRPSEFKRPSVRDSLKQSLISKSDSQVRSAPDIDPMFRRSDRFSEPEIITSHKLDYKPRQSTRSSMFPPEISGEYERQGSMAQPRDSTYDRRESRRSSAAPWEFQYEEQEISPRRSSALPRGSAYEKEEAEFSPRRSSAIPRGSSYEKHDSEFRRSSAAPRESQFEEREAEFSPRRSSAMPRDSVYDKRESEFRRSSAAPRESLIEERKSSPRRSSALPRESYYEERKSSVVPRDSSYEERESESIPRRSSAFPRDSVYEREEAEFSPRRSSAMPRVSSYEKRESEFRRSSAAPRESHIEERKSSPRRSSTLPRESLYEGGDPIPARRSSAKPRESVQEKSESDSGPRRSSAMPRESSYEKRESEFRRSSAAPRESQNVERKSSPRFSTLIREVKNEQMASSPVRKSSVAPRDDKLESDSSQRRSSAVPRDSIFEKHGIVFTKCPAAEQRESQFEERKSSPRRSSALPRESSYQEGEYIPDRRSSVKPRESVGDKRESEFRRNPTRTRELQFEELRSSPRRSSAVPIESAFDEEEFSPGRRSSAKPRESVQEKSESDSGPRRRSTKPRESVNDKRGSELRKSPKLNRELQFEERKSSPRRSSAVPIETAFDEEEFSPGRRSSAKPRESQYGAPESSLPAPRESQYEKRKSSPRRSSAMPRDSVYDKFESESIPRRSSAAPRESSYEKPESSPRRSSAVPRESSYKEQALEQSTSSEVPQKTPFERRGSSPRRSSAVPRESAYEKPESSPRRSSAVPRETLNEEGTREFNPRRSSAGPRKSRQYDEPKSSPRRSSAAAEESQSDKEESTRKTISAVLRESVYKWRESEVRMTKTSKKSQPEKPESKSRKSSLIPLESHHEEPGPSQRKSSVVPRESLYEEPDLSPSIPRESVYEKQETSPRRSSAMPRESLYEKRDSKVRRSSAASRGSLSDEQVSSPRASMAAGARAASSPKRSSAASRGSLSDEQVSSPRASMAAGARAASSPKRSSAAPRESVYGDRKSSPRRSSAAPRESSYNEQVLEQNTSSEVPQETPFERRESSPRRSSAAPRESEYEKRESSTRRSSAVPRESLYNEQVLEQNTSSEVPQETPFERRESSPRRSSATPRESAYEKAEFSPRRSSATPRESSYKEQVLEQSSSEVPQETPRERRASSPRRSSAGPRGSEPRSLATQESDAHQSTDLELENQDSKPRLSLVKKRVAQFENYPKIRKSLIPVHNDKREAEPRGSSAPPHHKRESESRRSSSPVRGSMAEKPRSSTSPRQSREQESFTSSTSPRQSFDEKRLSESRRISKPIRESEFEPRRSSVSPRQPYVEKRVSEPRRSSIPIRESLKERRESEPRRSSMSPRQSSDERRVSEPRKSFTPTKERRDSEARRSLTSPRESFADKRISSARRSSTSSYKLTDVIRRESGSISPRWMSIRPQDTKLENANTFIGLESSGVTSLSSQEFFMRETKTECFAIAESEVICPPVSRCDAIEMISSSSPSPEVICPCPCSYPTPVSPCSNESNEIFMCNVEMATPALGTITCGEAICKRVDPCCDQGLTSPRSLSPSVGYWYDFTVNDIKSDSDQAQQRRNTLHMIPAAARELEAKRESEVSRRRSTTDATRSRSFTELQTENYNRHVELRLSKTEDNLSTTSMEDQPVKSIHLKANVRQPPPKEVKMAMPSERHSDGPTTSPQSQSKSEAFYSEIQNKSGYIKEVDSELQNFIHYLQGRLKDCDDMVKKQLLNIEECTNKSFNQGVAKIEAPPPTESDAADEQVSTQPRSSVIVDLGAEGDCTSTPNQLVPVEDLTLPLDSSRMSGSEDGSCHCSHCEEGSSDSSEIPPFTGCECMREDYYKIMKLAYQKKRK